MNYSPESLFRGHILRPCPTDTQRAMDAVQAAGLNRSFAAVRLQQTMMSSRVERISIQAECGYCGRSKASKRCCHSETF